MSDTELDDAGYERQAALYRRACDQKHAEGCYQVFEMDRRAKDADPKRLSELLIIACDGGEASGCAFLADRYRDGIGVPKDHDKEVAARVSACSGYIYNDCREVQQLAKNPAEKRAREALQKWKADCQAGDERACDVAKKR